MSHTPAARARVARLPRNPGLHELRRPLWGRGNGSPLLPPILVHQVQHRRNLPRLLDAVAAAPAGTRAQARAGLRPRSTAERRSAVRSAIPNPASPALHTPSSYLLLSIGEVTATPFRAASWLAASKTLGNASSSKKRARAVRQGSQPRGNVNKLSVLSDHWSAALRSSTRIGYAAGAYEAPAA